ncbi:AbgT family transporter [Planococcus maritimus]|uniref:AbgT family transporter n=1 Tax=Planococcus maritimus TaxID=192421 RepID=UPI00079656FE|nr:AbgT family transporter [Planococcus maritimus]KYG58767.1 transporter [Planococcus maritimus]OED32467.1 p-aminobenzoyl-glutamate transporter [Planococcus maritimus]
MTTPTEQQDKKGFLNFIEKWGNRLPDPFFIFVYLAVFVVLLSWLVSSLGTTVVHPGTGEELAIQSLVSGEGIRYILAETINNFTGFAPLGLVLVMMLGIGLAERVGLMETAIKKSILNAPKSLVTYAVIFTGIMGNLASDAAFILVPPLAAMVFASVGRHPLAGLAAGFAGTGAGFTANILITGTDALLSGISTEAAKAIDDTMVVTPVDNWYFMSASVIIMAIVGALITEKLIEPRLGTYTGKNTKSFEPVTKQENKGLRNALLAAAVYIGLIALLLFFPGSPVRNEGGGIIPSPFLSGIVPIILFFFITVAVAYGITVKKITESKDIPAYMGDAIKDMSGYIVLIFAAAQFINYFNWSNLGIWLAVNSAEFLTSINMTGLPIMVGFSVLAALLNLLIFSGSAQWALMAPIFIPMFMLLDYHPAFVQLAFRIADSSTNIITPLNPYILIVLAFMREYDKKAGLGTLISLMLPYSLIFFGVWLVMLIVFALTGIPVGPGISLRM